MRLIDADKLLEVLNKKSVPFNASVNDAILTAPTVDAVEVVRCKDCKHFVKATDWFACKKWYMDIREDDYCSYGERKEE